MLVIPLMRWPPCVSILARCPPRTSRSPRSTSPPWRAGPRCPLPLPRRWSPPSWSSAGRCRRSPTRSVALSTPIRAGSPAPARSSCSRSAATSRCCGSSAPARPAALGLRESTQITLGGAAATRLLPTAGVGGAAVTLWSLRRAGLGGRGAARTLLTFLVLLYSVFLGSIAVDRHAARRSRGEPLGADRAAGRARHARHAAGARRRRACARRGQGPRQHRRGRARRRGPRRDRTPAVARPAAARRARLVGLRHGRAVRDAATRSAPHPASRSSSSRTSSARSATRSRSPAP